MVNLKEVWLKNIIISLIHITLPSRTKETTLFYGKSSLHVHKCKYQKCRNNNPTRPNVNLVKEDDIIMVVISQVNIVTNVKELTIALNDVLYVPNIRTNLVLVGLLGKVGIRIPFEFSKVIMTKNNVFVGKGYCNNRLFVLNNCETINGSASSYSYLIDLYDL
ncbi:Integrase, catalytic core [Gossypium australe]|uniref:Integrase, catalytic core n=1 Tax=Gossypium australe TaxID=47621 RepID=A0A5B6W7S1_9ROSI|nr:Integrase, catalytic core [Gossypium australe]